jgi:hypothetical protein
MQMALENYMLPCLSKSLFGFECMGCGFQRAFFLVFNGYFVDAFWMYPAIYPLFALAGILIISRFYKFKFYQKSINILSIISIAVIITNYLIKQTIL